MSDPAKQDPLRCRGRIHLEWQHVKRLDSQHFFSSDLFSILVILSFFEPMLLSLSDYWRCFYFSLCFSLSVAFWREALSSCHCFRSICSRSSTSPSQKSPSVEINLQFQDHCWILFILRASSALRFSFPRSHSDKSTLLSFCFLAALSYKPCLSFLARSWGSKTNVPILSFVPSWSLWILNLALFSPSPVVVVQTLLHQLHVEHLQLQVYLLRLFHLVPPQCCILRVTCSCCTLTLKPMMLLFKALTSV